MKIRFEYSIILFFSGFLIGNNHVALCALIICATVHELGHILCANILKIKIREMVIDIGGAKIYPYTDTYPYSHELLLSFSGPFINVLCALLLKFTCENYLNFQSILQTATDADLFFTQYVYLFSLIQAVLNLIPVNGLDGGRILKCTLCILFSQRVGDGAVKLTTLIFAIILWILSVYLLLGSGGGISLFIFSVCMLLKIFDS